MKYFVLIFIIISLFLSSCSKIRKSAGVTRKSLDEFQVVENPPLVVPPDFNLLPPNQLEKKNIDDVETELAQEILFGLDESLENNENKKLSVMNQILESTDANSFDSSIRIEIDEQFANEIKTDNIFQTEWGSEIEVLDAIKESERIRNQLIQGKSIAEGETPTTIQKTKSNRHAPHRRQHPRDVQRRDVPVDAPPVGERAAQDEQVPDGVVGHLQPRRNRHRAPLPDPASNRLRDPPPEFRSFAASAPRVGWLQSALMLCREQPLSLRSGSTHR